MKYGLLMRWSVMLECARELGLSRYAVKRAIAEGRLTPRKPRFAQTGRAFYARQEVEGLAREIVGEDGAQNEGLTGAKG